MFRKLGILFLLPTFLWAQDPGLSDDLSQPGAEAPADVGAPERNEEQIEFGIGASEGILGHIADRLGNGERVVISKVEFHAKGGAAGIGRESPFESAAFDAAVRRGRDGHGADLSGQTDRVGAGGYGSSGTQPPG